MCEYSSYTKDPSKFEKATYEYRLEGLLTLYEQIGRIIYEKEAKENQKMYSKSDENVQSSVDVFIKYFKAISDPNSDIDPENFYREDISLDDFFKILYYVKTMAKISPRMKFLIENLEHRKSSNWIASEFSFREQEPKTIKEIHQEYESKNSESEKIINDYYNSFASQRNKELTIQKK